MWKDYTSPQNTELAMIENSEYINKKHHDMLLDKEEGLDVSIYSNPEFNRFQIEQIRMGLKDKIDVSIYADPSYSHETMKQLRLSMYSSTNLNDYLNRGFVGEELEQIRLALEDNVQIDKWLTDDMYAQQIYEIRTGLKENLNVAVYADSKYNWMQMKEIRLGLEKKLNVSIYSNYLFNHWQMKEIRLGLEAGQNVSSYAKLIFSGTDMKEIREKLLKENSSIYMTADMLGLDIDSISKKQFSIFVEDEGNKVFILIQSVSGNIVTEEDIYAELKSRGIVIGIKHDVITEIIKKRKRNEKILIAEGIPAKDGKNGWYEFFVRLDLPRIPAPLPDGGVDYVNIEAFEMVEDGEKIAIYHPAECGTDGKNVFGEIIHANHGTEKKPLKGKGFIIDSDGVTYISKLNGKFEYINGMIFITNMVIVREDVTSVTGKLEVDGSVYVVGSVYSGGYISATGDIIIEYNAEAARLIAGGNIMIKKGSCSKNECFIQANGEVSGGFFEGANIEAEGNIMANYIMNSNISTMGKVIVSGSKGVLLGGKICAVKGVDTYNLGNKSHIKTVLEIGKNNLYNKKQEIFAAKREQISNELFILEERWNTILKTLPADKEQAEQLIQKLNNTIVEKDHELANLDAEASKLTNITEQDMRAVIVRGNAYEGSVIEINTIKYSLPSHVSRIVFKLKNNSVVMVKL